MDIERIKELFSKEKLIKTVRFTFAFTIVLLIVASAAITHFIKATTLEIEFDDLPASFDGYKVAVIADLHLGLYTKEKQISRLYNVLDEQNPDIVVIVGDHIYSAPGAFGHYNPKNLEIIKSVFSKISSKYPTYAVNGNHDNKENKDDIIAATIESGVVFLDNQYTWLTNANNIEERIYISGVGDLDTDMVDFTSALEDVDKNDFSIMLSHNPSVIGLATNSGNPSHDTYIDLMLAGHTHGGQINLGSVMDSMFEPGHKYGLKRYNNTELYVTSGVGVVLLPIRFNAPAEVAFITLRSSKTESIDDHKNGDITGITEVAEAE